MIIQRYMDLSKFLSLIQNKSFYLAKMSSFEDALEGGNTVSDFFNASNDARILDIALNHTLPGVDDLNSAREEKLAKSREFDEMLRKQKFTSPFGDYPSDDFKELFHTCREWLYVSCWHKSNYECLAMWKLYTKNPNSLCVFTTTAKIEALLNQCSHFPNIEFHDVNYISHGVDKLCDNPLAPFIAKSKPYSFEKEYRVIAWNADTDLYSKKINGINGELVGIAIDRLIDKLVISPFADDFFKQSVIELCSIYGLSVDVVDSELKTTPIRTIFDALAFIEKN